MWWEYGQGDKLINLRMIVSIYKCHNSKEDTVGMIDIQGRTLYFTFAGPKEACEAYQHLRGLVMSEDRPAVVPQRELDIDDFLEGFDYEAHY
jgi:hypothetical protein